jgi:hypothetical protein
MGYGAGINSLPADRRSLGKISLEKGLMSVFAGLDVNVSQIPRCRLCPQIIRTGATMHALRSALWR